MKLRGRPKKNRLVKKDPLVVKFSPRGRPGRPDEVDLKIDEFEAIRLVDCLGLKQVESANQMLISQQTFSRILRSARKALADAFINGKIIRVQKGG